MVNAGRPDRDEGHVEVQTDAALWVVRTRDADQSDLTTLDGWLQADPTHADAYMDAAGIWDDLGQVLPDWKRDPVAPPAPERAAAPRRMRIAVAAFASFAVACFLTVQWLVSPTPYATGIGEQRTITLADGTRATLNTDSMIRVSRFGDERRVTLERGEAQFDVTHDPRHPFLVSASDRTVRVLGTSFVMRREAGRVDVTLLSGSVAVERRGATTVQLQPGERYRQLPNQPARVDRPRIDIVTAWRSGKLLLDDTPLSDAIAEMNRYSGRPIILGEPGLGQQRLSGLFDTRDTDAFARTIAEIYDLRLQARRDGYHLVRIGKTAGR